MAEPAVTIQIPVCIFARLALSMIEQGTPKKSRRRRSAILLACAALVLIVQIPGAVAAHAGELTPSHMVLLDRLTWGITASSAAPVQAVGPQPRPYRALPR